MLAYPTIITPNYVCLGPKYIGFLLTRQVFLKKPGKIQAVNGLKAGFGIVFCKCLRRGNFLGSPFEFEGMKPVYTYLAKFVYTCIRFLCFIVGYFILVPKGHQVIELQYRI